MTNRGAAKWQLGDPIFMIETIYGDGSSKFKVFCSLSGYKSSKNAVQRDVLAHKNYNVPWATKSYRTYEMSKTEWEDFNG